MLPGMDHAISLSELVGRDQDIPRRQREMGWGACRRGASMNIGRSWEVGAPAGGALA